MSSTKFNQALTHPQFYELCRYLEANRSQLEREPATFTSLAHNLTNLLKMPVSTHALKRAALSTKLKLLSPQAKSSDHHTHRLWAALTSLARAHSQLCRELNSHCPPEIELLAQSDPDSPTRE